MKEENPPAPRPQSSSPPPRRPRGLNVATGFGDDDEPDPKPGPDPKRMPDEVRINLPPKTTAAPTVKLPTLPPMMGAKLNRPSLLLDFYIVVAGAALLFLISHFGLETGHPPVKGAGAVLGGIYILYLGGLFLLSYFFGRACYIFCFLSCICIHCSRPAGRHMAIFYFILSLVMGSWLLLVGLGFL